MKKPLSREKLLEFLYRQNGRYQIPVVNLIEAVDEGDFDEDAPAFDVGELKESLRDMQKCYNYDKSKDWNDGCDYVAGFYLKWLDAKLKKKACNPTHFEMLQVIKSCIDCGVLFPDIISNQNKKCPQHKSDVDNFNQCPEGNHKVKIESFGINDKGEISMMTSEPVVICKHCHKTIRNSVIKCRPSLMAGDCLFCRYAVEKGADSSTCPICNICEEPKVEEGKLCSTGNFEDLPRKNIIDADELVKWSGGYFATGQFSGEDVKNILKQYVKQTLEEP